MPRQDLPDGPVALPWARVLDFFYQPGELEALMRAAEAEEEDVSEETTDRPADPDPPP